MKLAIMSDNLTLRDSLETALHLQWPDGDLLTAGIAPGALADVTAEEPDLLLLNVPAGAAGLEMLAELRRQSEVPVLVLAEDDGEINQVRAFELGADDYLACPFSYLVLLARMQALLRRATLPTQGAVADFEAGDLAVDFREHKVTLGGEVVRLTPMEYKLLYHFVRNAGHLLTHQTLLDRVWGADYGATLDYLKVFVSRLRAKLEQPGGHQYIQTERGIGYRFVPPSHALAA